MEHTLCRQKFHYKPPAMLIQNSVELKIRIKSLSVIIYLKYDTSVFKIDKKFDMTITQENKSI